MDVNAVAAASDQMPTTRSVVVKMTADVNNYMGQMGLANKATNTFVETLVKLDQTLTKVKNVVGKGLMTSGALGTANITAATLEAARFEQSFANLAKVVKNDGVESLNGLERAVRGISTAMPVSASEVAGLAANVASLGVQGTKNIEKFTETAIKMGAATDVSGDQAVGSLTRLMRTFDVAPDKIDDLGGAIVRMANNSNTSASQILDFTQTIQGVAQVVGITLPQLVGMSAAITASGADSFAAANATSKVLLGMNRAVSLGGPELAKYAQLVGVTTDQFKALVKSNPADMFVAVAKAIKEQGSGALPILKVLGLDDTRSIKVLANIANASGDLNAKIKESQELFKSGGAGVLSDAANKEFSTFFNQLKQFKNNVEEVFIMMGKPFLKPLEQGLKIVNFLFELFNKSLAMVGAGMDKLQKFFDKLHLGWLLTTFKEFTTIMVGLVPALMIAGGAVVLFSSEIIAMLFAIRALRTVGPILEAFTKGLLGMRAGGAVWKIMDMVPFVNGIDKAGTKTKVLAGAFGLVGQAIRGTVTLAYDLVKALFIGSGPIERMRIAFSNLLLPIRKLINLIPFVNLDPSRLVKQSADTGLVQRAFAATFGGISRTFAVATGSMRMTWRIFTESISRTSMFAALTSQAQAFGAVLMAQAVRFKAAMATVSTPLVSAMSGLFAGLGTRLSGLMGGLGKNAANRITSQAVGGAVGGAASSAAGAGAAEAGVMAAALNPATLAAGAFAAALGGVWYATKRQRDAADKFTDSIDRAGSAADTLAVSLGKPKTEVDPDAASPGKGQFGFRAPSVVNGVKIDDKSLLDLVSATRGDTAKVKLLEGQYAQGAIRSGQELTPADLDQLRATARRAGLSGAAQAMLNSDITEAGQRGFNGPQFDENYIKALVASAFKNNANGLLDNFNQKPTTANFRAIGDAIAGNVTQFGGNKPNFDAVIANLAVLNREIFKRGGMSSSSPKAFHEALDEIASSFGKGSDDKKKLDFSGGGLYIRDIAGLLEWAKSNSGKGGIQGAFASAVRSARSELTSSTDSDRTVRDLVNRAQAAQDSIFAGVDLQAKKLNAGMENPYYATSQAQNFGAQDKATQSRLLANVDRGYGPNNQLKAYNDLLAARRRLTADMSETEASSDAVVIAMDTHLKTLGTTINKTASRQLDQKLATMGAADQMAYLDAQVKQTQKDMEALASTPGVPQDAIDNLQERLDNYQDKLNAAQSKGLSDLKSLVDLQKQQTSLDKNHARALSDAAKSRDKALKAQRESFNDSVKNLKEQLAQFKNPFERIQAEMTASAEDLVFNLHEQGTALANYKTELDKLRGMGLSADAIKGLGLDDPKNAAQVDRIFHDLLANPKLIGEINSEWAKRLNITGSLSTDKNSSAYSDLVKDFNKGQKEIQDQYNESIKRENESYKEQTKNISDNIAEIGKTTAQSLADLIKQGMDSSSGAVKAYATKLKAELDQFKTVITNLKGDLNRQAVFHISPDHKQLILDLGDQTVPGSLNDPNLPKTNPTPGATPAPTPPPQTPTPQPGPSPTPRTPTSPRVTPSAFHTSDHSTNFNGPMTVVANDTRTLQAELARKKRLQTLAGVS